MAIPPGIAQHAALPYASPLAGFESAQPVDDDQSVWQFREFDFIHT